MTIKPNPIAVLAKIALTEANGNSEPDEMAEALDECVSLALEFFKDSGINLAKWVGE